VGTGDVQLWLVGLRIDEDVHHFPVVPVKVGRELIEDRVEPELDHGEGRFLVLDGPIEHRRLRWTPLAIPFVVAAVERVEASDDGLPVALAGVRLRIRRKPWLARRSTASGEPCR